MLFSQSEAPGRGGNLDIVLRLGITCQPVRMKIHQERFCGEEALRVHTNRVTLLKVSACSHSLSQCLFKGPRYN